MQRDSLIQLVSAGVLGVSVVASGFLSTAIASEAGRSQLVYSDRATEGDPPAVATGIAMGAFRGLFVNYLWLRANRLKEEGKFHEAIQLSEAITTLQPRFPDVWAFHAWNMAYNISVATGTAEERWEWVQSGIDLLRDEAIPYNPNSVALHKELAWIYVHKVQGYMDDANRFYKREHAREWTYVMGVPPQLPEETEAAAQAMIDWLQPIVDAPSTFERLVEDERRAILDEMTEEARLRNPEPVTSIERLADEIRAIENVDLDLSLLRLLAYQQAVSQSWLAQAEEMRLSSSVSSERLNELLEDPQHAEAWSRLIPHVRKRVLQEDYKMQPLRMQRYTRQYGPLDWRHPASHSAYWASKGVEEGLERRATTEGTYVNTDRVIVQSLQELWRTGTLYYDILQPEQYIAMYSLHYTDSYGNVLEEIVRPRATTIDGPERAFSLYSEGYKNFLQEVIRLHYRLGNEPIAFQYLQKLASSDWLNTNDPFFLMELSELSLDQFVWNKLAEDRLKIPYVARTEITASLRDGIIRGLLQGDVRTFESTYQYAARLHKQYKEAQQVQTLADDQFDRMQELPEDTRDVAAMVALRLLTTGNMTPADIAEVYGRMPSGIQVRIYDPLAQMLGQAGSASEGFFRENFPEPPGLELLRIQRQRQQEQNEKRDLIIDESS